MPAPKKNVAFTFVVPLVDSANRPYFKANPTLAAGDFKHSGDGSALTNLGTLPTVDPASSRLVKIVLSQAEMNYDRVTIQCVDAAGGEWDDVVITINTTAVTVDDLVRSTTPANTLDVSADGEAGIDWANVGSPTTTVTLSGTTVKTATDVETDTQDIQARLPAALGANGNIKADVRDFSGTAGTFSGGRPEVNVSHWKGTAAATVDTGGYPVVTIKDGVGQGELATTSGKIDGVVLVDTLTTYTGNTPQTGDAYAIVNSGVHGNAAIKGYVDDIGAAGAGLTAIPWNAAWDAEVQSEVEDGLNNLGFTTTVSGRIDAAISTRLASASYTAPLDAAGTRTAVGLASANLDTQLAALAGYIDTEVAAILAAVDTEVAAIKAKTDNLPASPAATGDAMTLTSGERDAVAAALLDLANGVETGFTLRQAARLILAALAGKLSGAATTTVNIRDVGDSKNRIAATVDSDGNRTAVTLDAS